MILLIDTSTPTCKLTLIDGESRYDYSWEVGRELSKNLLGYLESSLSEHAKSWQGIKGLGCFKGPGSFTGLRIGLTVFNTLAQSLNIPIVGCTGDDWQTQVTARLKGGENDQIVMPEYGAQAHITAPRK